MTAPLRLIGAPSAPQAATTPAPTAPPGPVWLSTDDVAALVGVGRKTIADLRETDGLPAYRFGRVFRYRADEIAVWVDAHRYEPGGAR